MAVEQNKGFVMPEKRESALLLDEDVERRTGRSVAEWDRLVEVALGNCGIVAPEVQADGLIPPKRRITPRFHGVGTSDVTMPSFL